jgi:hypothetical protein
VTLICFGPGATVGDVGNGVGTVVAGAAGACVGCVHPQARTSAARRTVKRLKYRIRCESGGITDKYYDTAAARKDRSLISLQFYHQEWAIICLPEFRTARYNRKIFSDHVNGGPQFDRIPLTRRKAAFVNG